MRRILIALALGLGVAVLGGCQSTREAHDQECQQMGAVPGSEAYVQCRMHQAAMADARQETRRARMYQRLYCPNFHAGFVCF